MRFRTVGPLAFAVIVGLLVSPAGATATSCINGSTPGDSAINQYCETIPGSAGPQAPQAGSPTVSTTLPSRLIRALTARGYAPVGGDLSTGSRDAARRSAGTTRAARERLLTLPAPAVPTGHLHLSAASTSVWAPITALLIALAGITVVLAGAMAAVRGRRRGSED